MFVASLFTIARTWKSNLDVLGREMDKKAVVHIHNGIFS